MTWNQLTKNLSTYSNGTKERLISFLLQENQAYLLLETGAKIILEDHSFVDGSKNNSTFARLTKNASNFITKTKNQSNWNNLPKN